jgi:hypothetical protein
MRDCLPASNVACSFQASPAAKRSDGDSGFLQGREETVEEFVRRNLGDEVFERLIEPFCSGQCPQNAVLVEESGLVTR